MALWSCVDCGSTDEPLLTLQIGSKTTFRIDTLYGVGATGQNEMSKSYTFKLPGQYASFILPLNLNADSSRYALMVDGRLETITVFYTRKFYYKNHTCGYVFDLYPYAVAKAAQTTRGKVTSVIYTQNSFNGSFLRPSTSETGIQLSITL